ncbi:branched-chain amino acid aminotransferase [Amorphus orientalis]|uniref:Probable branched-chain-amino-acid aminotransferase n=1 Tax=Amorphus orientalis TaxID=649198 RepID=A0AAE3VRB5_9HYPH|nr:branched-chain amino acid aminotransferase [Amorphus orientalis]MDQ0317319.1 branched-chain amino acid aminotransferase [Amorphus orientalis]
MAEWSKTTWTWIDGDWIDGNPPIMGPTTHAAWLGSTVFDGARYFEGVMPDLDLHCERINRSAEAIGLKPTMSPGAIMELAREGVKKFDPDTAVYIRPMYWAEGDGFGIIAPDPDSTRFCLCLLDAPMPQPTGSSVMVSRFRRPSLETMPTDAKAGCLYPNTARMLREARDRGFDTALVLDPLGHVAELASSNVFMVKNGTVATPVANGTFLAGITRYRVMDLLTRDGYDVQAKTLTVADFMDADEVFTTGNYSKVTPINRIEDRNFQPGPVGARARELYWDFAHA